MRALVLFSPVVQGRKMNFKETMKQYILDPVNLISNKDYKSQILLLPSYVKSVKFVKGSKELPPLSVLDDEKVKNKPFYESKFQYMQFVDGTSVQIIGKVVPLALEDSKDKDKSKGQGGATNPTAAAPSEESGNETKTDGKTSRKDDGLFSGIIGYDKMGSDQKKRFRQRTGKLLIQYLANLKVLNQLSNWSSKNDVDESPAEDMLETAKAKFEIGKKVVAPKLIGEREPSQPIQAYTNEIRKSMTIVYFNDNKEPKKKEKITDWDKTSDAEREYKYEQAKQKIEVIKERINAIDGSIKDELGKVEEREMKQQLLLKRYENQSGMEKRYNTIDTEIAALTTQINGIITPSTATAMEKSNLENQKAKLENQKKELEEEKAEIKTAMGKLVADQKSLEEMKKLREEQNRLIESKKKLEKEDIKSKEEYEAGKELEDIKEWTESLIGIELGLPVRYMYVPEVEIVSYKETASLSEKTEGEFHVIVRQTSKTQYVRVGDPLTLGISAGGDLIKGIFNVLGGVNKGGTHGTK